MQWLVALECNDAKALDPQEGIESQAIDRCNRYVDCLTCDTVAHYITALVKRSRFMSISSLLRIL
jgi:hypothetical protein